MMPPNWAIIDANINRATEGLRVLEDYCRFHRHDETLTHMLAHFRHQLNESNPDWANQLQSRHTPSDVRAMEPPRTRESVVGLLRANCSRVQEAMRVLEEWTGRALYCDIRYRMYDVEQQLVLSALKPPINTGIMVISDQPKILAQAQEQGAIMVQLRVKNTPKATIYPLAQQARDLIRDIPLIINDYLDLAVAIHADGLHTGQDDLPLSVLRDQLGSYRLLGRTTHTLDQGKIAKESGADYISVGPIWETPSKPGRAGIGFGYLGQVATLGIPYVAIGGIDLDRLPQILAYSPPMVGMIRDVANLPKMADLFYASHGSQSVGGDHREGEGHS